MLIPRHWAEARLQLRERGRQATVKRWGWSDLSQKDAQRLADQRAEEAMQRAWAGEKLRRRETLDTYGTEEGVPIREEVVSRHGDSVVTRNSYGALCLNTPHVFFADVDTTWEMGFGLHRFLFLGLLLSSIGAAFSFGNLGAGLVTFVAGFLLWIGGLWLFNRPRTSSHKKRVREAALRAIRAFSASHPDWHLRVYETPAGYRLMAMHDVFDPKGEEARRAMEEMNSDRRFVTLCRLQSCFRARVSPKSWRIGYRPKLPLPKAKYPFPPEALAVRREWIAGYEAAAPAFASCRFLERLGSGRTHPLAEAVRTLHDDLCRAHSGLPLA